MTPAELHTAVHTAVTTRLELAHSAEQLGGTVVCATWTHDRYAVMAGEIILVNPNSWFGPEHVAAHMAANDPAATIRACEADLERLAHHAPLGGCSICGPHCHELARMATVYAVQAE